MRLPGPSQWVCAMMPATARAAASRATRGTARRRAEHFDAEGLTSFAREEEEKRYPIVPVQVIALEPEQQGGTGPDI